MSEARFDTSFIDEGREARRRRTQNRTRYALFVSAGITVVWMIYVTAAGHWGRVADHWASAVTMVFGSFVAGSTPQGGGAVAFPVFTKVLEVPAEVARSFSLCIQTVGMGAASLAIIINRRVVEWRAVAIGAPVAMASFLAALFLFGDRDTPFWPSTLPGPYVKVTFTIVLAAMAWLVYLGTKVPVRKVDAALPLMNHRLRVALVVAGILGGLASALVGSGADVMIYLFVVVLFGLDSRVGIPTSVLVMTAVSIMGFVVLGLFDGQLSVSLDAAGDNVVALGGSAVSAGPDGPVFARGPGIEGSRFDLFGLWLAAAPVVGWGAPLGSWVASRVNARQLVRFVVFLAVTEIVSTIVFLDELHSDIGLILYGVLGVAVAITTLTLLAANRQRLFGLPGIAADETLSRRDVAVTDDYYSRLEDDT